MCFMKSIGGKEALLSQFQTIKEHHLPRNKIVRKMVEEAMLPFLMYMTRVQPDIAQQLMVNKVDHCLFHFIYVLSHFQVLAKFSRFLFKVYKDLQKKESLSRLKTLVHGDAKIDNFMLKKVYGTEDVFTAMLIDWQGCCFDRVTNDLMWCLYGFIKNLPETGEMIHGYVDYSLGTSKQTFLKLIILDSFSSLLG